MSTSTSTSTHPTWLVTGTSSGLGLSLSQHILKQGHNLVSISRHPQPDPSLVALSNSDSSRSNASGGSGSGTLTHIPLDLSNPDPTPIKSAISTFLQSGTIDILVNNAAITLSDALEHVSPPHLHHVMATNFYSPVYLIQSLLPQMRQSPNVNGHPKVIINISSTQGLCTDPSELSYDASKHALEAMSGVLAAEVAMFGVRVLVVELGSLRTGFATSAEGRLRMPQSERVQSQSQSQSQQQQQQQKSEVDQGQKGRGGASNSDADPYADPSHPVAKRKAGVKRLASEPGLARGDPTKTAGVLFDAVMTTKGSVVREVLEAQRRRTVEDAKKTGVERGVVERLVLGSDAQPKIERVVNRLRFDVESCREVSGVIEADE